MTDAPESILFDPKTRTVVTEEWRAAVVERVSERGADFHPYLRSDLVPSWQPIETAPRDEYMEILGWREGWNRPWVFVRIGGAWLRGQALHITPTCWQPLPTPPTEKE